MFCHSTARIKAGQADDKKGSAWLSLALE